MRLRILLGTFILIFGLAAYCLVVMRLASEALPAHWAVDALFYFAAGTLWILPAARLTRWMQRAAPTTPGSAGSSSPRSDRSRGRAAWRCRPSRGRARPISRPDRPTG